MSRTTLQSAQLAYDNRSDPRLEVDDDDDYEHGDDDTCQLCGIEFGSGKHRCPEAE